MKKVLLVISVVILSITRAFAGNLDVETGMVSAGYNDVQVPGNTGTRFSLTNDLGVESKVFYRIRLTKALKNNKAVSFLYAPLSLNASGVLKQQVNYNGDTFSAGTSVNGVYRFDSYRISYWKTYKKSDKFSYKLGVTGKIRDAAIKISGNGIKSEKKNTGFVPLLNIGCTYNLNDKAAFVFDADALAGGPGRAEDVLISGQYKVSDRSNIKIGYRFVEGGADVAEVYNFALLNYIVAGFSYEF